MKRIGVALFAYGSFLILSGIVGFASGRTFGLLSLCLGWLAL